MLVRKTKSFSSNRLQVMGRIFLPVLLLLPLLSFSQTANELRKAETNFAAHSVQHGTRAAFLAFADSSGVVFENGRAVNAIATWQQRRARPGVLNWRPWFVWAAASGDLGFSTGPWTFQPGSVQDSVVARGQFTTVWHKTIRGEWKFLADLGVSKTQASEKWPPVAGETAPPFDPGTEAELLETEDRFAQTSQDSAGRAKAYAAVLSRGLFFLNRNGRRSVTTLSGVAGLLAGMPASIRYQRQGHGLAPSGDLGYVYGGTNIDGKAGSYLHLWRREARAWKLVMEVLPY